MKKVFIDTNVFIDYVAQRGKFYVPAATIISLANQGLFSLTVSSLSFATASYVLESHYDKTPGEIVASFSQFVSLCSISSVDEAIVISAINNPFRDFEDALQFHTAMANGADCIITRNKGDFTTRSVPILEPQEFLDMLAV